MGKKIALKVNKQIKKAEKKLDSSKLLLDNSCYKHFAPTELIEV